MTEAVWNQAKVFKREVCCVGRIISEHGYSMNPKEIEVVQALKWEMPSTVREVRKLMGFLGYYRSYIADSAKTAKPLYELLTKPSMCKMKGSGKKGSPSSQASPSQPVEWDRETSGSAGEADCKLEKLIASWGRVVKPTHYGVPRFREAICSSRGCVKRRARSRIVPTKGRQTQSSGLWVLDSNPCRKELQDALWKVGVPRARMGDHRAFP